MRLPKEYAHQAKAFAKSKDKDAFAFLMEPGTGKTRPTIKTAEYRFKKGDIEAVMVFAPNGVQRNWVLKEIPKWCKTPYRAAWYGNQLTRKRQQDLDAVVARPYNGLRIIAVNFEMAVNPTCKKYLLKFLRSFKTMIVLDESTRIRNPTASRTKFIVSLRNKAPVRRILTGLATPRSPFDLYKQFEFLDPNILGFSSYYAYKAHFAVMENNPRFLHAIQMKHATGKDGQKSVRALRGNPIDINSVYKGKVTNVLVKPLGFVQEGDTVVEVDHKYDILSSKAGTVQKVDVMVGDRVDIEQRVVRLIQAPMLIKKDAKGQPLYKNIEQLYELIEPHSFRALKKDCLDLPEKLFSMLSIELTDKQRHYYDIVANEVVAEFEEGNMTQKLAIVRLMRLQQITAGFWKPDGEKSIKPIDGEFPKLEAIMEDLEGTEGKAAIWTHFQHENELIAGALREAYGYDSVVQYYGKVSNDQKEIAKDRFNNIRRDKKGNPIDHDSGCRFWIGEPSSGGIGIDAMLAETVYYHSNSYNLEDRIQSEDRHHRGGFRELRTKWGLSHSVLYKDVEALNTVDQVVIESLRNKLDVAQVIMNDKPSKWI
jgi:biotin carboxyl carrier protein